jgi:N-acetylglucosamine-1-phosphate uridyltransferase (contains nucleotidyltransferase and I-patch acetyltransferase domains)
MGTAHALKTALPHVSTDNVFVLLGDVPMLSEFTISKLQEEIKKKVLVVLTGTVNNLYGYVKNLQRPRWKTKRHY